MSIDTQFTKDNLDEYLKEVAKEYKKSNRKSPPIEIILIGGAAILANYGFREMTYDVDAVISAGTSMKEAINTVGDRHGLPNGWLNSDFTRTRSYSDKLYEISSYYRTFSNMVVVRIVSAEYLIAMKLMSGRRYKNDLSDIAGILWEHERNGNPITKEAVDKAVSMLYGNWDKIPPHSIQLFDEIFTNPDYETLYMKSRESEVQAKSALLEFNDEYPGVMKEDNIESILAMARHKKQESESGGKQ